MYHYEVKQMSKDKHRLYFLLDAVAHRLKTTADQALLKTAGLTTAQVTTLRIIVDDGPISPKQVADKLRQRKSAMTTMVRRLEKAGFVVRSASKSDKRSYVLSSTKSGEEAISRLVDAFTEIDTIIGQELSATSIATMSSNLEVMLRALRAEHLRKTSAGRDAA